MEKQRKLSQIIARSSLKFLLYLGRGKGIQGMWQWWNQPVAKGGVPRFFWPFLRAKNVSSFSHKTLLTAWLGLCSWWRAYDFCVVILRPSLMCPLARKKFVGIFGVWTKTEDCVTSAEGRAPYSDYSVTCALQLRRVTSLPAVDFLWTPHGRSPAADGALLIGKVTAKRG